MDRGTRLYSIFLIAIVVMLVFVALYKPARVRALNEILENDASLAAYPYQFRVLSVKNGIAVMSTPRSTSMPVQRMIGAIYPQLRQIPVTDPAYLQAQKELAEHQALARSLITADPAINDVRWSLDHTWLVQHGIQPDG